MGIATTLGLVGAGAGPILMDVAGPSGAGAAIDSSAISGGMSTVWTVVTDCCSFIAGSPLLLVFLAGGLIPIGLKIFRKAKRSVK